MCLVRTSNLKEKAKDGYKRWLSLQQFFVVLMLIFLVLQFCMVLPRDAPYTHKVELRGSFNTLQPLLKQTTTIFIYNTSFDKRFSTSPTGTIEKGGNIHDDEEHTHVPSLRSTNQTSNQITGQNRSHDFQQINHFQTAMARNYDRQKHLRDQCNLLLQNQTTARNTYTKKDIVRILTSPTLNLIYCRVNKAASWYTIHMLQKILNCNEECMRRYSQRLRSLSSAKKKNQMKKSFNFFFVREPYGRLFSTFCNKFYFPKGFWDPIGTDIVKQYRKNPSAESLKYGYDVTFPELVRYTIDEFEAGRKMDAHIRPMHSNCKPCEYEYDFIGKLETFKSDMDYLAHELKIRNISANIPEKIGEKTISFDEMYFVRSFLDKIKYSKIDVYNIYNRSWHYYQITSVISKHIEMPFSRSDDIKFYTFLTKLKDASKQSNILFADIRSQHYEALLQAYSTVPLKDLERLKEVVREDCLLFGYEESPSWLFDRTKSPNMSSSYNYFSGVHGDS